MVALTIGMATYDDFDGVYFTIQALRLYQDLDDTELLVVDNFGCDATRDFLKSWTKARYVLATEAVGTAAAKNRVFAEAKGKAVLCCDSHIFFAPGVIARLKAYHHDHPKTNDLLQGPLLFDDLQNLASHFAPEWRDQMFGIWGSDPRASNLNGKPFEIPMQGMGVFSCRRKAWPGFNPAFRGFGGEEGYIHEKFRQSGGRTLCLPWLRWAHRFSRPKGVPYPLSIDDKLRNYLIGHGELGLDAKPALKHFAEFLPEDRIDAIRKEARRALQGQGIDPKDGKKGKNSGKRKKSKSSAAKADGKLTDLSQAPKVAMISGARQNGAGGKAAVNAASFSANELLPGQNHRGRASEIAGAEALASEKPGPFPAGLVIAPGPEDPSVGMFPLVLREDDELEIAYVARIAHQIEDAIAAGNSHLVVPSDAADWLGDDSLLAAYFAEQHELIAADLETGFVFGLHALAPAVTGEGAGPDGP